MSLFSPGIVLAIGGFAAGYLGHAYVYPFVSKAAKYVKDFIAKVKKAV